MLHSPSPRKAVDLSESLHRRLNVYALAASAAGVSALALSQAAEARIIYTPASIQLQRGEPFPLDLNHDGKVDFYLFHYYWAETSGGTNDLLACHTLWFNQHGPFCYISSKGSNAIRVTRSNAYGAALPFGAKIAAEDRFRTAGPNRQPS